MIYNAYQSQQDVLAPLRAMSRLGAPWLDDAPFGQGAGSPGRHWAAAWRTFELSEITHRRPAWGIGTVEVDGHPVPVTEEVVASTPFATLLRFRKEGAAPQPKVLIVAPMSGHFATLLRDTVRTTLRDHDVYVTDWHNARDVALSDGPFGLDEYTMVLIDFLGTIGPGAHMMAICQPCVAAIAAVALMSEDDHRATPASLTLMAGPVDCRISPTAVNRHANSKPIDWFEANLISTVPWRQRGAGRRVYPGFVQLSAFMSMNRQRHADAFIDYYGYLLNDEIDKAEAVRTFYREYFAVSDLPAEFFLETVARIFQDYALPKGEWTVAGRRIDPAAIRRTALVTIEGEMDDICSIGQTLAAHDLAKSLRPYMRTHYVQPNVGHYGVFAGKRWQNHIYPVIRDVIFVSQ